MKQREEMRTEDIWALEDIFAADEQWWLAVEWVNLPKHCTDVWS